MSRFIIIVDRDGDCLVPIVDGVDDGAMAIYGTRQEAEDVAERSLLCLAYPYIIIDYDEVFE